MPSDATPGSGSLSSLPVALLATACLMALGVWWVVRSAERRALEEELSAYAGTPLATAVTPIDPALADVGARVFEARCAGCHALRGDPKLGPNLAGITLARDPAWLRAMIIRPDSMTRDDPVARALLQAYGVQMQVSGGMDGSATRAVMEFLRRVDRG
ncbi:MAG TPA: cytochrome c [Longimicrobiales bacterium]|nr:cytochrome c [Longimicrobiales bacterium]